MSKQVSKTVMPGRVANKGPERIGKFVKIDKISANSNRISCSKCIHYIEATKNCAKKDLYVPTLGYDYWKYCRSFSGTKEIDNDKDRAYIRKVKKQIQTIARRQKEEQPQFERLVLLDLVSRKEVTYRIDKEEQGEFIVPPSHTLVIKARRTQVGKSFSHDGKTYRVVEK